MIMKAERMKFIFDKHRGDGAFVKTWEEFDSGQQSLMLKGSKLSPDEVPVIGIVEGPNPLVITTKRILWHSHETQYSLDLSEINGVRVPEFVESNKLDLYRLWLITGSGKEYLVETKPGKPFFVLWNLLIRITDQPKQADKPF